MSTNDEMLYALKDMFEYAWTEGNSFTFEEDGVLEDFISYLLFRETPFDDLR